MTTATASTSPTIAAAVNLGELTVADTTSVWTDDQWANAIKGKLSQSVLSIIETGVLLKERRAACDQKGTRLNTFEVFCKVYLKMSQQQAQRYVSIGRYESLNMHVQTLPASMGTLYELTRLTKTEFDQAIQSGAIHPEMTRAEAEALRSNRPALPASSNQAPQAQDKKDNAPSPAPTLPPVSPPTADESEDDDAPFDLGPSGFVDSSTAPTHRSEPASTVNKNEEHTDAFSYQRSLIAVTDPKTHFTIKDEADRTVKTTTDSQVLYYAQQRMFTHMNTRVSQAQGADYAVQAPDGASFLEAAIQDTVQDTLALKEKIMAHVEEIFNTGLSTFAQDCEKIITAADQKANMKLLYQGFRRDTPTNIAVASLKKIIESLN